MAKFPIRKDNCTLYLRYNKYLIFRIIYNNFFNKDLLFSPGSLQVSITFIENKSVVINK